MELPDFSSLWEARNTLQKLQESLLKDHCTRNEPAAQRPRKRGPDNYPNYYSDGICGVSFGIAKPEFANPLATCCQLHFFTREELDRHTAEHVPCPGLAGVEGSGCGRALHPSVLAFHLEVDHAPIVVERTSNDIEHGDSFLQRWREARRRNYPTFERVQAKIREVGYRIERGQVLLTRKFGSLNSRKPQELRKPRDKGVSRPDSATSRITKTNAPSNREEPKPPDAESRVQRPPELASGEHVEKSTPAVEDGGGGGGGEGRSSEGAETRREEGGASRVPLVAYDSDVSWSEQVEMDEGGATHPPPSRGKSLIEQLESVRPRNVQAEENAENPPPASPVPTPSERRESRGTRLRQRRRRNRRREERPARHARDERTATTSPELEEETGVEMDEVSAKGGAKAFAAHPVVQMFAKRRACMRNASLITKRPTLLQMLLAEEMRHERNQLMQCVRYVVRNNFFLPK